MSEYNVYGFMVDFQKMIMSGLGNDGNNVLVGIEIINNIWLYKIQYSDFPRVLSPEWQIELNNCYKQWLTEKILLS